MSIAWVGREYEYWAIASRLDSANVNADIATSQTDLVAVITHLF
ncbi:hypothetical protein [Chamaesiphon sp.]